LGSNDPHILDCIGGQGSGATMLYCYPKRDPVDRRRAAMNRKMIVLSVCLLFALACLGTTTPGSSAAVDTEVARQLTSMAALTQSGAKPPSQDAGSGPGELPTVTPTELPPPSPTPTLTPTNTQTPSFTP